MSEVKRYKLPITDESFEQDFQQWWEEHGQYVRSGGTGHEVPFAFQAWRHLVPMIAELQASSARLAAENERLREEHDKAWRHAGVAEENLKKAIAELEALRQPVALSQDTIREVFLRNGFTIKEAYDDLKPYVYAAANELLQLQAARLKRHSTGWTPVTERLPDEDVDVLCKCLDGEEEFYVVASQHNSFFTDFDHALLPVVEWQSIPKKSTNQQLTTGEQQEPKLDKPAKVGAARFSAGIRWRTVILSDTSRRSNLRPCWTIYKTKVRWLCVKKIKIPLLK